MPQFVERESKVIGPFTFKQFIPIGIAGVILFMIYFTSPMSIFIPLCVILGVPALAFAFLKIQGQTLPTVIKNFFIYSASPRIYLWKRKTMAPRLIHGAPKSALKGQKADKTPSLKITERGHLQDLSTQVETRVK
ncbi:MAG: PrgI family protein [Patescibacteria group bacterium]